MRGTLWHLRTVGIAATLLAAPPLAVARAENTERPEACANAVPPVQPIAAPATAPPIELTAAQEEAILRDILKDAIATYESKHGGRIGKGWCGNMFGHGDKCNVVHDRMESILDKAIREHVNEHGAPFRHHDIGTIVASGRIAEAVSGHVYMALYRVDPKTGKPTSTVVTYDPWRNRKGLFATDPNVGADAPILWSLPKMRPQVTQKAAAQ